MYNINGWKSTNDSKNAQKEILEEGKDGEENEVQLYKPIAKGIFESCAWFDTLEWEEQNNSPFSSKFWVDSVFLLHEKWKRPSVL